MVIGGGERWRGEEGRRGDLTTTGGGAEEVARYYEKSWL